MQHRTHGPSPTGARHRTTASLNTGVMRTVAFGKIVDDARRRAEVIDRGLRERSPDLETLLGIWKQRARRLQAAYDAVAATHRGHPLDEVRYALGHAWLAADGAPLKDPALTDLAERIVAGRRTVLR